MLVENSPDNDTFWSLFAMMHESAFVAALAFVVVGSSCSENLSQLFGTEFRLHRTYFGAVPHPSDEVFSGA